MIDLTEITGCITALATVFTAFFACYQQMDRKKSSRKALYLCLADVEEKYENNRNIVIRIFDVNDTNAPIYELLANNKNNIYSDIEELNQVKIKFDQCRQWLPKDEEAFVHILIERLTYFFNLSKRLQKDAEEGNLGSIAQYENMIQKAMKPDTLQILGVTQGNSFQTIMSTCFENVEQDWKRVHEILKDNRYTKKV